MIAATLQRLHATGRLPISRIADATGIDESSIYRWMSGHNDPGFTKVMLLFRHCGDERVQNDILSIMTRSLPFVTIRLPDSFDVDGDGDVDCDDARKAAANALRSMADFLEGMAMGEQPISDKLMQVIEGQTSEAIQHLLVAQKACQFVHEHQRPRRKARSLAITE